MNSDDLQGKKAELSDFAAQAIKDLYPSAPDVVVPPHVEARKRAGAVSRRVHSLVCQLVSAGGDSNPSAAIDYIFQQFYSEFSTWSKDDLLFLVCVTHSIMEAGNVGIPVFENDSRIIRPS